MAKKNPGGNLTIPSPQTLDPITGLPMEQDKKEIIIDPSVTNSRELYDQVSTGTHSGRYMTPN